VDERRKTSRQRHGFPYLPLFIGSDGAGNPRRRPAALDRRFLAPDYSVGPPQNLTPTSNCRRSQSQKIGVVPWATSTPQATALYKGSFVAGRTLASIWREGTTQGMYEAPLSEADSPSTSVHRGPPVIPSNPSKYFALFAEKYLPCSATTVPTDRDYVHSGGFDNHGRASRTGLYRRKNLNQGAPTITSAIEIYIRVFLFPSFFSLLPSIILYFVSLFTFVSSPVLQFSPFPVPALSFQHSQSIIPLSITQAPVCCRHHPSFSYPSYPSLIPPPPPPPPPTATKNRPTPPPPPPPPSPTPKTANEDTGRIRSARPILAGFTIPMASRRAKKPDLPLKPRAATPS